jgi:hypothetical protein
MKTIKVMRLIEECAELQHALCKAERFGWSNWHPDRPERTNMDDVLDEINDVERAIQELRDHMALGAAQRVTP